MLTMMLLVHCGVMTETCACTGKSSLAVPFGGDCCPQDSNCMSINVHQFSGNYLLSNTFVDPPMVTIAETFFPTLPDPAVLSDELSAKPLCSSPPGNGCCTKTVLRV